MNNDETNIYRIKIGFIVFQIIRHDLNTCICLNQCSKHTLSSPIEVIPKHAMNASKAEEAKIVEHEICFLRGNKKLTGC